jgi:hypothetical protein
LIDRCACPAQICVAIDGMRELSRFEAACLDANEGDREIHILIKEVAERNHRALEDCLTKVLRIEGWDMNSLKMPEAMRAKLFEGSDPRKV